MLNMIKQSGWFVGGMIFFMPILLIFFLASQMAYGQVQGKFEAYQTIPEITRLSDLEMQPEGQIVMLRGEISESTPVLPSHAPTDLIVFQERPADGREVRYREEFPLIFPEEVVLDLSDGSLPVLPSLTRERVIQAELHTVLIDDRQHTGFRIGDTVTVQGEWQPGEAGFALHDVTGISGKDKAGLMAAWQDAFQWVQWARNGFGFLTLLSISLLLFEVWRNKQRGKNSEGEESWPTQETKTAPTTTSPY